MLEPSTFEAYWQSANGPEDLNLNAPIFSLIFSSFRRELQRRGISVPQHALYDVIPYCTYGTYLGVVVEQRDARDLTDNPVAICFALYEDDDDGAIQMAPIDSQVSEDRYIDAYTNDGRPFQREHVVRSALHILYDDAVHRLAPYN